MEDDAWYRSLSVWVDAPASNSDHLSRAVLGGARLRSIEMPLGLGGRTSLSDTRARSPCSVSVLDTGHAEPCAPHREPRCEPAQCGPPARAVSGHPGRVRGSTRVR